ncbi:MAG: tetratricopeptide repeat protein [Myxococcales bacterium]|nr:tetratricopeptide repeat protein [Myxococcales bacterium]
MEPTSNSDEWQGIDPWEAKAHGDACAADGKLAKASQWYMRALDLAAPGPDRECLGVLRHAMGDLHSRLGNVAAAREWYELAMLVTGRQPTVGMANSTHMAAVCRFGQREFAEAFEWFERAANMKLHLVGEPVDFENVGVSLHMAGFAQARLGDLDGAQAWRARAAAAKEQGDAAGRIDSTSLGMTFHLSGDLFFAQQKYEEAIAQLERAAASKERGNVDGKIDWSNVAMSYELAGFAHLRRRDFAAGLPCFERAVDAVEKGDLFARVDELAVGRGLRFVGMCRAEGGDNEGALLPLTRASDIYTRGVQEGKLERDELDAVLTQLIECCPRGGAHDRDRRPACLPPPSRRPTSPRARLGSKSLRFRARPVRARSRGPTLSSGGVPPAPRSVLRPRQESSG